MQVHKNTKYKQGIGQSLSLSLSHSLSLSLPRMNKQNYTAHFNYCRIIHATSSSFFLTVVPSEWLGAISHVFKIDQ